MTPTELIQSQTTTSIYDDTRIVPYLVALEAIYLTQNEVIAAREDHIETIEKLTPVEDILKIYNNYEEIIKSLEETIDIKSFISYAEALDIVQSHDEYPSDALAFLRNNPVPRRAILTDNELVEYFENS